MAFAMKSSNPSRLPLLAAEATGSQTTTAAKTARRKSLRIRLHFFRNDIGRSIWLPRQHTIRLRIPGKREGLRIERQFPAQPVADIGEVRQVRRKHADCYVSVQVLIISA